MPDWADLLILLFLLLVFGGIPFVIVRNVRAARRGDWSPGWLFKIVLVLSTVTVWDLLAKAADARNPLAWLPVFLIAATFAAIATRYAWRAEPGSIVAESLTWITVGTLLSVLSVPDTELGSWEFVAQGACFIAILTMIRLARPNPFPWWP